jgi:hypothetical protein
MERKKINDEIFDLDLGSLTDFGVSIRYPDDFYLPDSYWALSEPLSNNL